MFIVTSNIMKFSKIFSGEIVLFYFTTLAKIDPHCAGEWSNFELFSPLPGV